MQWRRRSRAWRVISSFLASDDQEGRDTGSEGIQRAGSFIADRFQSLGLNTQLFDGQAFQTFSIPGPPVMGDAAKNRLSISGELPAGFAIPLELDRDFRSMSLGSSGEFSGEIVFAGYGITAPDWGYDDYANVDVKGKVVIVLRKEPQQNQASSKFDGLRTTQFAYFSSKEANAVMHQAAAMILVNDLPSASQESGDYLLAVEEAGKALTDNQIPTLAVRRAALDPLLKAVLGKDLKELEDAIDADLQPQSQVLPGVMVSGETLIETSQIAARNVVACLPGAGALVDEFVVVGAHYDHVGMGGPGSLAPGTVAIHNGADDNASGTTTLLEVAKRMAQDNTPDRRSIVFIAFSAEEKGLLGSKYYASHPRFPLEDTVAMVNMDMVGRLTDNNLTVYGTGTADGFDALVDRMNREPPFILDKQPAGFGPSDHASFYEKNIPVFHFFTGLHNDYHRPSDDFERVNLDGMARIANMVTDVVRELSTQTERPRLIKSSAVADVGRTLRGRPTRPRAVFGITLDLGAEVAKIESVTPDGPGSKAGLQAGDVITQVGDSRVPDSSELRRLMSDKKPGESDGDYCIAG